MQSTVKQAAVTCGIYTGIHAFFSRGDFHSIEGTPLSKIPHTWAEDEPDNYNDNESCIMMLDTGELADVNCSEPLPYLCYRKTSRTVRNNCGTVDSEYTFDTRTGSCYKFHRTPRIWSRAYMTCVAEGGHLVVINSDTEAQVLREIFNRNPTNTMKGDFYKDGAFVGFHNWDEHGEFLTIEGQTLEQAGYAKWHDGEPSNSSGQYCGASYRTALLIDHWCDRVFPFICEKSPDSLLCDDTDDSQ